MPDFTIRGNPSGVRSRAATTRAKADSFMTTGDALAKVTTDGWNSRAADRFRDRFDTEPERWREAGDGFVTAASALEAYAGALETAQKRAQWAEGEYARGEQVTDQARSAYDSDVARAKDKVQTAAAAGQHMTLTILPFHDPGASIRQGALDEYASARRDLEAAAHTCADGVRAGCAAAPAKRKWYEKVGAAVGGFLEGAGEALMDLGKLAAFLTNPAVFVFNDMMADAMSGMTSEEIAAKYELKLEDAQGLLDALQEDPLEFGKNIGKAMLDWDTWADDPARALGHLLPDAVIAVLTAGSGTVATRGAKGGVDALDALAGMSKVDDLAELRHLDDLGGLSKLDDLDPSRIYRMEDGLDHATTFAPEQLGARSGLDGLLDDALSDTPWSRQNLIDKINTPTHDLSPADRALLNDIRDRVPMPRAGDTMQKVITPEQFDEYLSGSSQRYESFDPSNIGGSVTRAEDTSHLGSPRDLHDGLRLDYENTPFSPGDDAVRVIRFRSGEDGYVVPRNSDMGGSNRFDDWGDPFTGNGFTKAGDDVVPEFRTQGPVQMRDGAEMWQNLDTGTQRLVAVLRDGEWVSVR